MYYHTNITMVQKIVPKYDIITLKNRTFFIYHVKITLKTIRIKRYTTV